MSIWRCKRTHRRSTAFGMSGAKHDLEAYRRASVDGFKNAIAYKWTPYSLEFLLITKDAVVCAYDARNEITRTSGDIFENRPIPPHLHLEEGRRAVATHVPPLLRYVFQGEAEGRIVPCVSPRLSGGWLPTSESRKHWPFNAKHRL